MFVYLCSIIQKHDRREKDKGVQKYRHDRHKERHDDKYRKDKREVFSPFSNFSKVFFQERRLDKDKYKDNHREKDRDRRDKDKKRHEGLIVDYSLQKIIKRLRAEDQ